MPPECARGAHGRTPRESAAGERTDTHIVAVGPAAFDARAAAAFVGVNSRAHLLRLVAAGRAPRGIELGAHCVWSRVELAVWIEAGTPGIATRAARRPTGGLP